MANTFKVNLLKTVIMKQKILIVVIGVFITLQGLSQGFYNKGSIVSMSNQAILSVPDSLVNTGTIVNNGDLRISGAWINQGIYDAAGTGKINFDSDLPQTINHNNQSFNRLVISGTGEKNFLANITIESELDLQSSNLKSANGAKIILLAGSVVNGGSDASHVIGPVENQGLGNWIFPVGNGTTYLPVEMSPGTDAADHATLTLNELTSGSLTGDQELTELSAKRYWELSLAEGTLTNRKLKLPLSDEDGLTNNLSLLVVAGSDAATSGYSSLGQSDLIGDLTSGSVTSKDALTRKYYTVAAVSGETKIEVFNGISVSNDGKNDFLRIKNIELYPNNKVAIVNRWGDKIFEVEGYSNLIADKRFNGDAKSGGSKVPAGTYFYSINLGDGSKVVTGYLQVK